MTRPRLYIQRGVLAILATAFVLFVIYSLSGLESFFRSSDENGDAVLINEPDFLNELPKISWQKNEAVDLDEYTQKKIAKAYAGAWKLHNRWLETGAEGGLSDYFGDSLLMEMKMAKDTHSFVRSNILHRIKPHHFSIDKQSIAFTDHDALVATQFGKDLETNFSTWEYDVLMSLKDGKWRIEHIRNTDAKVIEKRTYDVVQLVDKPINGINYYPAKYPWLEFWSNFDPEIVAKDFKKIASNGFTHVRAFIPFEANPHDDLLRDIQKFMSLAEDDDLEVVLALFDFPKDYSVSSYPLHYKYLDKVLGALQSSNNLAAIDVKNEPDLDFLIYEEKEVHQWLKFIIQSIRSMDPKIPLTIGWSKYSMAAGMAEHLDFISFHFYGKADELEEQVLELRKLNKPIWLTEYGYPTAGIFRSEDDQKDYLESMSKSIGELGVEGDFIWAYSDFEIAPSYVFGWNPLHKSKQKSFGLWNTDGSPKIYLKERKLD